MKCSKIEMEVKQGLPNYSSRTISAEVVADAEESIALTDVPGAMALMSECLKRSLREVPQGKLVAMLSDSCTDKTKDEESAAIEVEAPKKTTPKRKTTPKKKASAEKASPKKEVKKVEESSASDDDDDFGDIDLE